MSRIISCTQPFLHIVPLHCRVGDFRLKTLYIRLYGLAHFSENSLLLWNNLTMIASLFEQDFVVERWGESVRNKQILISVTESTKNMTAMGFRIINTCVFISPLVSLWEKGWGTCKYMFSISHRKLCLALRIHKCIVLLSFLRGYNILFHEYFCRKPCCCQAQWHNQKGSGRTLLKVWTTAKCCSIEFSYSPLFSKNTVVPFSTCLPFSCRLSQPVFSPFQLLLCVNGADLASEAKSNHILHSGKSKAVMRNQFTLPLKTKRWKCLQWGMILLSLQVSRFCLCFQLLMIHDKQSKESMSYKHFTILHLKTELLLFPFYFPHVVVLTG